MDSSLLIPGSATATTASVWAGIVSLNARATRPANAWLEKDDGTRLPLTTWDEWPTPHGDQGVLSARGVLTGLTPRTRQRLTMKIDNQIVASAFVSTLPDHLPSIEDPLRIMLGSCFCSAEDDGRLGRRFSALPGGLRPELKILCGDQVYLDSPFYKFLLPRTKNGLAKLFLKNYAETWGVAGSSVGFQTVLSDGPNVFTSDDHEYWNNAPFPSSFSVNTLTPGGRADWLELARALYTRFQTDEPTVRQIDVGDLSILIADTRIERSGDRSTFLSAADMNRIVSWIQGLQAPGLFVVGQPLFAGQAGITGRIADWNLPDFKQYETLCRALVDSRQPIVILTGDVHFGRVSGVVTHRGVELAEIISSPMSLVTGAGKRQWHGAPKKFPSDPIRGIAQLPITKLAEWERATDHFVTLELWSSGNGFGVRVRTWETKPDAGSPSDPVFEHLFKRRA